LTYIVTSSTCTIYRIMATLMSIEWNDMDKALFYKIIRRDKSE